MVPTSLGDHQEVLNRENKQIFVGFPPHYNLQYLTLTFFVIAICLKCQLHVNNRDVLCYLACDARGSAQWLRLPARTKM